MGDYRNFFRLSGVLRPKFKPQALGLNNLASPGDRFDVRVSPEGKFILTKLEPVQEIPPAKVRIEKRGRYHLGVLDRPINEEALKEALADIP